MSYYVLDDEGQPVAVPELTLADRVALLEDLRNRRVAFTSRGVVEVSTVFLMMGDFPFLWETMILGGPLEGHQERASTMEMAILQHMDAVRVAFPRRPPKTVWGNVPGLNPDGTVGTIKVEGLSVWDRLLGERELV